MVIAGFLPGSGPTGLITWDGLLGCGTVEVADMVGFGCTGPIERKDRVKSGSDASALISSDLDAATRGGGFTVGPCSPGEVVGRGVDGALDCGAGVRVGYCRAADPAAREALDADDPMASNAIAASKRRNRSMDVVIELKIEPQMR